MCLYIRCVYKSVCEILKALKLNMNMMMFVLWLHKEHKEVTAS